MAMSRREICAAGLALGSTGAAAAPVPDPAAAQPPLTWPLVELRRYRTRPGRRDELIALFEREFVETQEAVGMRIIGTFREPGHPDRFTWLRGFTDMPARARALNAFYFGPVWHAHREAANACIDDSDDVLLMAEAWPGSGFKADARPRPAPGQGPADGPGLVVARACWPQSPSGLAPAAQARAMAQLAAAETQVIGAYVREGAPNNFPRLPVREAEPFFVWFERHAPGPPPPQPPPIPDLKRPVETLLLHPTRRSSLHG